MILTEGHEQEYGLELTPVYSRWRLWVNGKLKQSVGMDGNINGDMGPRPPVSMVTFTAKDRIEIVVEAEDDSHFTAAWYIRRLLACRSWCPEPLNCGF